MSKNKFTRIILFGLAIWLVLSLSTMLTSFMFKTWQQAKQPSTSGIIAGLQSQNETERKAVLDKIKYPIWSEPRKWGQSTIVSNMVKLKGWV